MSTPTFGLADGHAIADRHAPQLFGLIVLPALDKLRPVTVVIPRHGKHTT